MDVVALESAHAGMARAWWQSPLGRAVPMVPEVRVLLWSRNHDPGVITYMGLDSVLLEPVQHFDHLANHLRLWGVEGTWSSMTPPECRWMCPLRPHLDERWRPHPSVLQRVRRSKKNRNVHIWCSAGPYLGNTDGMSTTSAGISGTEHGVTAILSETRSGRTVEGKQTTLSSMLHAFMRNKRVH